MGKRAVHMFVAVLAVFVCGFCQAMTAPRANINNNNNNIHSHKSLLLGVKTHLRDGSTPTANALGPIQVLVEDMKSMMLQDTIDTIEADNNFSSTERDELQGLRTSVENLNISLAQHQNNLQIVQAHEQATQDALTETTLRQSQIQQSLTQHDGVCMSNVPRLNREADHIARDLDLLAMLQNKINQLDSQNAVALRAMATELAHVSSQITHSPSDIASNLLLDLESASEPESDSDKLSRMKRLLGRLVSEVQTVLADIRAQVKTINETCIVQAAELQSSLASANSQVTSLQLTLDARNKEIKSESQAIGTTQAQLTQATADLHVVESRVTDRMHIFLALTRKRQNTVLILAQMERVLSLYSEQLQSLPVV
eukprot:c6866_g1_i1.p1 GENE.c6866_g1_i1~~c6866_g1_i1.p1  ORF type:complete len:370 (+),score=106.98 c6866_g1_i1:50-1159(+)